MKRLGSLYVPCPTKCKALWQEGHPTKPKHLDGFFMWQPLKGAAEIKTQNILSPWDSWIWHWAADISCTDFKLKICQTMNSGWIWTVHQHQLDAALFICLPMLKHVSHSCFISASLQRTAAADGNEATDDNNKELKQLSWSSNSEKKIQQQQQRSLVFEELQWPKAAREIWIVSYWSVKS